jgi:RNA polymerase sigma-70 factor (ECF subfamily)
MAESESDSWEQVLETAFTDGYRDLYKEAKKILGNTGDAEDVIQDLYIKLAQSDVQPEIRSNPQGYLRRVVQNACKDVLRSRKRRKNDKPIEDLEESFAPESERAHENVCDQIEMALASMSSEVKEIVTLHCVDGYSDSEIAEMRGESRSKVASILSRSRAKVKSKY